MRVALLAAGAALLLAFFLYPRDPLAELFDRAPEDTAIAIVIPDLHGVLERLSEDRALVDALAAWAGPDLEALLNARERLREGIAGPLVLYVRADGQALTVARLTARAAGALAAGTRIEELDRRNLTYRTHLRILEIGSETARASLRYELPRELSVYVRGPRLSNLPLRGLGFLFKRLAPFERVTATIRWDDRIRVRAVAACRRFDCVHVVSVAEAALQVREQQDFAALWRELADPEEIRRFEQVYGGSVESDILSKLGPTYSLEVVRVRYPKPPKYALPCFRISIDLKERAAGERIVDLLGRAFHDIRARDPSFGFELVRDGTIWRIQPGEEERAMLGEGLDPAIAVEDRRIVFATYAPALRAPEKPGEARGCRLVLAVDGAAVRGILEDMLEFIAQTQVNNRFRENLEPEVDREMNRRFDPVFREQKIREAGEEGLAKFLYDQRMQLLQERLHAASQSEAYRATLAEERDRVRCRIRVFERFSLEVVSRHE